MAMQAAFLFLAGGAEPATHRCTLRTPQVDLTVIGVPDYSAAEAVARDLVAHGTVAIELCGGFGHAGVARIVAAVDGKAAVGAVRFDGHPGLEGKSGDAVFATA
ncbi:MAG: DUF6506 family protein [Acetobacteraceae bacterium]|nr:DUF6506 family protein [Acetobacteraceae bacterium]